MEPFNTQELDELLARVGAVAENYSNLTETEAVRFVMAVEGVDEVQARFRYGLAAGTITGDVIEAKP